MLQTTFDKETVSISLEPEDSLTLLGFALQSGFEWLVGGGCWSILVRRIPAPPQYFKFNLQGQTPFKYLAFSKVVNFKTLLDNGFIPKSIPGESTLKPERSDIVRLGMERIKTRDDYTLFKTSGCDLEQPMASICYGMADLSIELMKNKATEISLKISIESNEIGFDKHFTDKQLINLFTNPFSYDASETLASLRNK